MLDARKLKTKTNENTIDDYIQNNEIPTNNLYKSEILEMKFKCTN